ncbi:MAG TPA: pinensin family lanthipeptide [Luteibaculaceae bacterium]|nr:pinensin family lanthipeptide [Luteibaculaceae bacterium]
MKKVKLSLHDLRISSFVTQIYEDQQRKNLLGGALEAPELPTMPYNCSAVDACVTIRVCVTAGQSCVVCN